MAKLGFGTGYLPEIKHSYSNSMLVQREWDLRYFKPASAVLVALVIAVAFAIQSHWASEVEIAREHYIAENHERALSHANRMNEVISTIYGNLRTLSNLPSVRNIDRHAANMSEEGRLTFQQIYNNLADAVAVSEVYILPIDFAPDRLDPVTLKTEEPIAAFDQLIVYAANGMSRIERQSHSQILADPNYNGPAEIETFEYRQMVEHAAWLKAHYPTSNSFSGLDAPFISGSEVITCDNSRFISTASDKDRSGIIFSVPFYGPSGNIKGMISGIILSDALRELLPAANLALVNPNNQYIVSGPDAAKLITSQDSISNGLPDPDLVYSDAITLPVKDSRSQWKLWAGEPAAAFYATSDVVSNGDSRRNSFLMLASFATAALLFMALIRRNLRQAHDLAESLKAQRDLAAYSEITAQEAAAKLQTLNDDITSLNIELASRFKQLAEAQDEMVRSGRMVQLGQLVGTVAHEIRNPLSGIRNTIFLLKRKMKDDDFDPTSQFARIESGIARCDNIISQLLDFSHNQEIVCEVHDLVGWQMALLDGAAAHVDPAIIIKLMIAHDELQVGFDRDRLGRAVVNLFNNACDAVMRRREKEPGFRPEVSVDVAHTARGVEIKITDNGPGIADDLLPKIGEPLFTTKSFGSGLGVAAALQVAKLHGGGLDIQSVAGQGAKFTIWLPTREVNLMVA